MLLQYTKFSPLVRSKLCNTLFSSRVILQCGLYRKNFKVVIYIASTLKAHSNEFAATFIPSSNERTSFYRFVVRVIIRYFRYRWYLKGYIIRYFASQLGQKSFANKLPTRLQWDSISKCYVLKSPLRKLFVRKTFHNDTISKE